MLHDVVQRLRVTFSISDPLVYVSVVDLGRTWDRVLIRSRVPVAYSQGYNPHTRMAFAAALPVGYASECEVVDIYLGREMSPLDFVAATAQKLPQGLAILRAETVDIKSKPLQALMQEAHYDLSLCSSSSAQDVQDAVAALLSRDSIPRERRKKKGRISTYDMRRLLLDLEHTASRDSWHCLNLSVRCGNEGAGRPEEVIQELGLPVNQYTIKRTALIWQGGDGPKHEESES